MIFIVVDVFEKIDVPRSPGPGRAGRAPSIYRAPEVVVQVLPVALLLATFLALGSSATSSGS